MCILPKKLEGSQESEGHKEVVHKGLKGRKKGEKYDVNWVLVVNRGLEGRQNGKC